MKTEFYPSALVPCSDDKSGFYFQPAHLNTILAALRFYQDSGQCDAKVRTKSIDHIATGCCRTESMTSVMIDDLCRALGKDFFSRMNDPSSEETHETLRLYAGLHDRLSDMIEDGRLSESDIPQDYQWLANMLAHIGRRIPIKEELPKNSSRWIERAMELLSESQVAWEDEEDSVKAEHAEHIRRLELFFDEWRNRDRSGSRG